MTITYLQRFLRRNNNSRTLYTFPGIFDSEKNGVEGSWRQDKYKEMNFAKNVPRRLTLIVSAKEIRDEFKKCFTTDVWNGKINTFKNYYLVLTFSVSTTACNSYLSNR